MAGPYSQIGRQLGGSIGSFFNPRAQQAGELAGLQQAGLEQQLQLGALKMDAARQDAADKAQEAAMRTPEASINRVSAAFGVPLDNVGDVATALQTGRIDRFDPNAGPAMPTPEWAAPKNLGRIAQMFAAEQAVQGGATKDVAGYFKALTDQAEAGVAQGLTTGELTPLQVAQRMYALKGNAPYSFNEYGVGNQLEGTVDTSGPAATRYADYRTAQTGAQKANAVQSYASADASRASAENSRANAQKTRQEMLDGVNPTGGKAPTGYRWVGNALEPIPGGPADPATKGAKLAKPPTEGQAKALMFGSRMAIADEVINELGKTGNNLPNMTKQAVESIPLVGNALGMGANKLLASEGQQRVEQAQRDFINAVLRRESGAAIADSEFDNARKQYFPQPGDTPAVLRQKAANRRTAIEGMKAEFGEQSMPQFLDIVRGARSTRQAPGKAAAPAAPTKIATDADYAALPSGARFQAPDGSVRVKP